MPALRDTAALFRLDGRVAVVTGGAGLYGTHISEALAEQGAHVIIASRGVEAGALLAHRLAERGLSAEALPLDLAAEESIVALRDQIMATHGRIDILFNNAVARGGSIPEETGASDWEATLRVNATGLFLCTKHMAEVMKAQRQGAIVNIASIYGVVGPDFSIYGVTGMRNPVTYAYDKGGLVNLTRYLATYYAPFAIRVNCISPGGYFTGQPEEFVRNYERRTPLGRMANDEDIKGPAVFLASDASAYITGQNLLVDGGWTSW